MYFHPSILSKQIQDHLLCNNWTIVVGSRKFSSIHTLDRDKGMRFEDQSQAHSPNDSTVQGVAVKCEVLVKHLGIIDGIVMTCSLQELHRNGEHEIAAKLTAHNHRIQSQAS